MPTVLSVFPNILNTILTILSALYLFHTFAKAKRKPIFVLFLVLSVFALSGVIWFTKIKQLRFVLMFAVVFLLSFSFKMKLLHRVLLTAALAALSGISDVIALLSQMLLFDVSSEQTFKEPNYSLGVIQTFVILFIALFIIHHARHRLFTNIYNKKFIILYTLPIATVLAIWTEYAIACNFEINNSIKILLLVNATVLILANLIIFYFSDNIYDRLQSEYQLRVAEEMITEQKQQYASLVENNSETRQIKHDQKNFILGALAELKQHHYEELELQLNKQLESLNSFSFPSTELPIVHAIIDFKSKSAKESSAKIECSTRILAKSTINDIDLAILLGNLLDNAIEATAVLPDHSKKEIRVFVEVTEPQMIVSVTNPVIKDINVNHLKTTKNDSQNHGYGLLAVRRIADKYNGPLLLDCQNNTFGASAVLNQPE